MKGTANASVKDSQEYTVFKLNGGEKNFRQQDGFKDKNPFQNNTVISQDTDTSV